MVRLQLPPAPPAFACYKVTSKGCRVVARRAQAGFPLRPSFGSASHSLALWCNSSMPGFDPDGLGANPSEAANFRSVVKQDHIWPTPRNRRGSTFPSDHPSPVGYGAAGHVPRGVIRSASVSETGGPGAKPGEAATFLKSKVQSLKSRVIQQRTNT